MRSRVVVAVIGPNLGLEEGRRRRVRIDELHVRAQLRVVQLDRVGVRVVVSLVSARESREGESHHSVHTDRLVVGASCLWAQRQVLDTPTSSHTPARDRVCPDATLMRPCVRD